MAIGCAAIPDILLESELFGYEKGAFTSAARQTQGNIEYGNSGTLCLDEFGDLPLPLQAKLLRFLQERIIVCVGGRQESPVDVQVVSATHQSLSDLIASGGFREELYYRLCEIAINIPALRDRQGEAVVLVNYFLNKEAEQQHKGPMTLTQDVLAAIDAYRWPDNI